MTDNPFLYGLASASRLSQTVAFLQISAYSVRYAAEKSRFARQQHAQEVNITQAPIN